MNHVSMKPFKNENYPCPVSVIMPVFNTEKYVSDAISSILNQTFFDFEFIIINDGSTDNSMAIIQSFTDDRMTVVQNEKNIGNYPSRNRGIGMAKGKYIAVMDSDDIALPDRLWKQHDYMENNPSTLATGTQFEFLGNDGNNFKVNRPVSYHAICAGLLDNNYIVHPSLFIRSEAVKQLGGYDEQYTYSSDYDLVCRLSLIGKIENLKDKCLRYRWHPGQISQSKSLAQKEFADKIRQNYQIKFINRFKSPALPEVGEAETAHPVMGRVIGLYIMGQCFNRAFHEMANKLLDFLLNNIHESIPLTVKNDLPAIGSGLIYLLRNHFVERDENLPTQQRIKKTIAQLLEMPPKK